MMFGFNGEYRTRPKVSLRGASKYEEKNALIIKNQFERKKREDQRKKGNSAITIQSSYRSYLARKAHHSLERQLFDSQMLGASKDNASLSKETLLELQRRLLLFYQFGTDDQRLLEICKLHLKHRSAIGMLFSSDYQQTWLFQLKKILLLCCRFFGKVDQNTPIALQLRLMEIYSSLDLYLKSGIDTHTAQLLASEIFFFLIKQGYFQHIISLLNSRLEDPVEETCRPPNQMAQISLDLIVHPIKLLVNSPKRAFLLVCLCKDLLQQQFSNQVKFFLLPALVERRIIPFGSLLNIILSSAIQTDASQQVEPSPWLLYSILKVAVTELESSGDGTVLVLYLRVLELLLSALPSVSLLAAIDSNFDLEEEDEAMDISSKDQRAEAEVSRLIGECIDMVNSDHNVWALTSLTSKRDQEVLTSLCNICHLMMTRFSLPIHSSSLLTRLTFSEKFLRHLWFEVTTVSTSSVTGSRVSLLQQLAKGLQLSETNSQSIVPLLSLFCSLFSQSLITVHDVEFYGDNTEHQKYKMPFNLPELCGMSLALRDACLGMIELAHPHTRQVREGYQQAMQSIGGPGLNTHNQPLSTPVKWDYLFTVCVRLVRQLYSRDVRRRFCPINHWLSDRIQVGLTKDKFHTNYHACFSMAENLRVRSRLRSEANQVSPVMSEEGAIMTTSEARQMTVLTEMPFVIPFEERVKLFQNLLLKDKLESQGTELHDLLPEYQINIKIRRSHIYEDAFDRLRPENEPTLKKKIRVTLINPQGLPEAGIDGGGIFQEFLSELLKTGFDPNRSFFRTTHDRLLYPNSQAVTVYGRDTVHHYYFLGRMLGKAIYENMLIELPFANFFLSKILSRHHAGVDIHYLQSLDPEIYKHLIDLKYLPDVSEMNLDFTVVEENFGESVVRELKPGGSKLAVTNDNRIEYIHLMADYRLNKQIKAHCVAFRQGLADVVDINWLRMFNYNELQTLISGTPTPIDLSDLKKHTKYSGGYTQTHPVIQHFWKVVEGFSDQQMRKLLKFVTSCSRSPLLGFKDLHPAFCIHYGGSEQDRLPSASTCMNLLKLPFFFDEETLKEKLVYAVESESGFELS